MQQMCWQTIPIQECGQACPNTHKLTDVRYESPKAVLAKVSIVKADRKCSLAVENPVAAGETTSGHLIADPPPSRLIHNFDRLR